ncbi:hypothetical protein SASPL_105222 [Salvia splendens]|uniref:DC1 domain-containing protein n=1 Tax=Salvia splendens TaxID=180675 RepID=A0A8X9A8H5_SALSN|nr:hypothetical protein SASPL_105222 [Salvia splendens]
MDESEQQHYVDFYSGSRRRRTCWDPPSRTSGGRVEEIRAPPLSEPPPQPVPEPELFYGPTHRGASDTPASKYTTRPSFGPRGFLHADSDVPSRFPPSSYTGQQREQPQTWNRHLHPTFPSPRTPAHPQLVLDQKPPLQHVLDQQPRPSRHRTAPPPPLHMDQQRSSSCGHPTTHLRQAAAYLELPTTVKQPLLQRPPSCLRSPSLHSATKLVSCEEKYLESDAKVLNQVDLRLNEKKLVDDEVRAIEINQAENIGHQDKKLAIEIFHLILVGDEEDDYNHKLMVHFRKIDQHPLHLITTNTTGNDHDVCEEDIEWKYWFYHCAKSDYSFHVNCIPSLGFLSEVKFGGKFSMSGHSHPLTLKRMLTFGRNERRGHCHEIILGLVDQVAFSCSQCDYWIHFSCARDSFTSSENCGSMVFGEIDEQELYDAIM